MLVWTENRDLDEVASRDGESQIVTQALILYWTSLILYYCDRWFSHRYVTVTADL